jgi:ubiquinone/menaquinone biosynthesis C-methylase UbiE
MAINSIGTDSLQSPISNTARDRYLTERTAHWDYVAQNMEQWQGGKFYQAKLAYFYRLMVSPGLRVLELGCGQGDLLAALEPSIGVGVDFSKYMIEQAVRRYPNLKFIQADVHNLSLSGKFDVIILSDLANDLWDIQTILENISNLTHPGSRLILNTYSNLWAKPLDIAQRLGLATPTLLQNWLTVEDLTNLLYLTGFEVVKHTREILYPLSSAFLEPMLNQFLVKLWPFYHGALTNFVLARPVATPELSERPKEPLVSVIVPARNEAGNIKAIFDRIPKMGRETEIVFVEGHSKDNTYAMIEQTIQDYPEQQCKLFRQTGKGKGDAVRLGFSEASGDILMILDADLTVPPEDLPRFYEALLSGKGDFVNGVRLIYPMENQAMRFLNLIGNKFFGLAFSWLLGQPIKDTLCGTKVLWKQDYQLIADNRAYFGEFDPFGDFDLLFGATKLNMKIVDLPVRYRERTYGSTNIDRWRHGLLLLRMVMFAASRIKFV